MAKLSLEPEEIVRYAMAVGAGLLLTAAYPRPSVAGLAWVAPGLILAAAAGSGGGQAFRVGYVAGLIHFLTSLYWLLYMPVNAIRVVAWVALSGYLALYIAGWVWLCWRMLPLVETTGRPQTLGRRLDGFAEVNWFGRACWAVASATVWVGLEMVRARFLTGFPWNPLGASQYQVLPLIQVSAVTGVYGVSFLVVWFSTALVSGGLMLVRRGNQGWGWVRDLMLPLLVLALVVTGGTRRLFAASQAAEERTVKIALIQPSIPQTMIWDPAADSTRFARLLGITQTALTNKPDVVIWPEGAVPGYFRLDETVRGVVSELVRSNGVWLILEAQDAVWREGPREDPESFNYYNSSFLVDPNGQIVGDYRKRRLVVFGEYIPLVRWLPFMRYLTPIGSGFTAGEEAVRFRLPALGIQTSVLICFEDVFPHLAPDGIDEDTDFLVNLTNDGWFGRSAAQWQHAANAVFRAVENGLPLVRSANNGLSCWVDGWGRVRRLFEDERGSVYGEGFLVVNLPLLDGPRGRLTFYGMHGDWFGWGCVSCSLLAVGLAVVRWRRA